MDWLEQELTQALARKEPGSGFDAQGARAHCTAGRGGWPSPPRSW